MDTGIEVLPLVPVVYVGLDKVGRELIGRLREWIRWVSEISGRREIVNCNRRKVE